MSAEVEASTIQVPTGDIKELVERHTTLRYKARSSGGEYCGACPWGDCGGHDRFIVWPAVGRYYCRGCERHGDTLDYLCRHDGLSLLDACTTLDSDFDPGRLPEVAARRRVQYAGGDVTLQSPPAPAWSLRAEEFVEASEARLWSPKHADSAKTLAYLRARGLSDETIRLWRLGYSGRDLWDEPKSWGLENAEEPARKVWLPRGIVIPCFDAEGVLWSVKVRRPLPGDELAAAIGPIQPRPDREEPKYWALRGHQPGLFGLHTLPGRDVVVIAEGEFDAMLLSQQAGDLVGVVTLGSAYLKLEGRWILPLLPARRILIAYDVDEAGEKRAKRLGQLSARARRVQPLLGKDLSEMHTLGGDVRAWVVYQLARHAPPELVPEPTVATVAAMPPGPTDEPTDVPDLARWADALSSATPPLPVPPLPPARFRMDIRWGRQKGDLSVRDPFTGEWHDVPADACPDWWRLEARAAKVADAARRMYGGRVSA